MPGPGLGGGKTGGAFGAPGTEGLTCGDGFGAPGTDGLTCGDGFGAPGTEGLTCGDGFGAPGTDGLTCGDGFGAPGTEGLTCGDGFGAPGADGEVFGAPGAEGVFVGPPNGGGVIPGGPVWVPGGVMLPGGVRSAAKTLASALSGSRMLRAPPPVTNRKVLLMCWPPIWLGLRGNSATGPGAVLKGVEVAPALKGGKSGPFAFTCARVPGSLWIGGGEGGNGCAGTGLGGGEGGNGCAGTGLGGGEGGTAFLARLTGALPAPFRGLLAITHSRDADRQSP